MAIHRRGTLGERHAPLLERLRRPPLLLAADRALAAVAVGGRVFFMRPCIFSVDKY